MNERTPLVSAVIPTRNRPDLVCRAVQSVLTQTVREIECIVVIDGPDAATRHSLEEIDDPRLRVIALADSVGGCEARNLGARAARGEWVGLLDDDDEWLPFRLERQLAAAANSPEPVTMVVSRFLDRGEGDADLLRPHIFPREGQPISDFLWCEVSCLGGIAGFPQTSTWLLRRDFLLEVPFTKGLKVLQDLDWLLRGYGHQRMRVVFIAEPLTIFHNDQARHRVSKRIDWRVLSPVGDGQSPSLYDKGVRLLPRYLLPQSSRTTTGRLAGVEAFASGDLVFRKDYTEAHDALPSIRLCLPVG